MKKIVIKSKLKEDEALDAFATLNKELQDKGLLSKGDELLAGIDDQEDGTLLIEVNGDLMDKSKYKSLKDRLLALGTLVSNDLKNFDESDENPDDKDPNKPEVAKGQEKEDKEKVIDDKVATSLSLHDTKDLLINLKSNIMFETLLFSEEELEKNPQNPENPEKPEAPNDAPEVKEHDDKEPGAPKDPEKSEESEDKNSEVKDFDDLYFSEDEINGAKAHEESVEKPEVPAGTEIKDATVSKKAFDKFCKDFSEFKEFCSKNFDSLVNAKNERKECPIEKALAIKTLAEYLAKAAAGKDLSVAEKYFCDSMKKYFSDEEVKNYSEEHKDEIEKTLHDDKPDAPKVDPVEHEDPKDKPEDMKPITKEDLIRSLNKEKTANTLKGLAESEKHTIK